MTSNSNCKKLKKTCSKLKSKCKKTLKSALGSSSKAKKCIRALGGKADKKVNIFCEAKCKTCGKLYPNIAIGVDETPINIIIRIKRKIINFLQIFSKLMENGDHGVPTVHVP